MYLHAEFGAFASVFKKAISAIRNQNYAGFLLHYDTVGKTQHEFPDPKHPFSKVGKNSDSTQTDFITLQADSPQIQ